MPKTRLRATCAPSFFQILDPPLPSSYVIFLTVTIMHRIGQIQDQIHSYISWIFNACSCLMWTLQIRIIWPMTWRCSWQRHKIPKNSWSTECHYSDLIYTNRRGVVLKTRSLAPVWQAKLDQENLLRMVRWHCPPDTGFKILEVWGRAHWATSRSGRLSTILSFTSGWERNNFLFLSNCRDRETNPKLQLERQRC